MLSLTKPKVPKHVWQLLGVAAALLVTFLAGEGAKDQLFGAGYAPVTGFSTMTTARISASDTTIPVASVSDKAGNAIVPANISSSSTVYMYFSLEPGTTREEPVVCTGISGLNLTGCIRGVPFQGSTITSSSTIAQIHNAGSAVIMTNLGVFYGNEFVGTNGNQTIYDVKTFNTFPAVTSTTGLPVSANELATKYYVDAVGAGGFTANNVSSTLGLQAISSGVPDCPSAAACVGVSASTTDSNNGGFLNFAAITGKLYWDVVSFLAHAWTWSGAQTFQNVAGAVMTGTLTVQSPTSTTDAASKGYVDAQRGSWSTGADGLCTISATTTLTADKHCTNLVVATGTTLYTAGYGIYATGTVYVQGILGNMGGTGTTSTPPGVSSSTVMGGGGTGGNGGVGDVAGVAGTSTIASLGGAGGRGDGDGSNAGGAGGTVSAAVVSPLSGLSANFFTTWTATATAHQVMGGAGGGGAHGTNGSGSVGGAGGGGGGGVLVSAPTITISSTGGISANGGNGVTGAFSSGGGGGFVILRYLTLSNSGFVTASGGTCTTQRSPACAAGSDGHVYFLDLNYSN